MNLDDEKRASAQKAMSYVEDGNIVGVGTGSTVAFFIEGLGRIRDRIEGAVSSSEQSTQRLKAVGIRVLDLNACGDLPLYVDGADESARRSRARRSCSRPAAASSASSTLRSSSTRWAGSRCRSR